MSKFMSWFLTYSAENEEYLLRPAGYAVLVVLLLAVLGAIFLIAKRSGKKSAKMGTKEMVFCAVAIALATAVSELTFIKFPMGGSVTLFSMLFVSMIGYFYGPKIGITAGLAYGVLQLITGSYIYHPLQVLLDYPLAFACLGLSGLFYQKKHGLLTGYVVGVLGRYICHCISGYIFFSSYAPESMGPVIYTLVYNAGYIFPEMIATVIILLLPPVQKAIGQIKRQAIN